jgi:hypothetical protein
VVPLAKLGVTSMLIGIDRGPQSLPAAHAGTRGAWAQSNAHGAALVERPLLGLCAATGARRSGGGAGPTMEVATAVVACATMNRSGA